MTDNALVNIADVDAIERTGRAMAASGYFSDAKDAAQAFVKICAGRELGFGPVASMTGINIIKGKVSVGANLMASAIKRDPRYDYRVAALTDERCEIAFFEDGRELGRSTFTKEDATAAGLMNDTWRKFTRNMLFARALSNGAKWYVPDACGGSPVYTPDELGAPVDGEGDVIAVTATPMPVPEPSTTTPTPEPADTGSNGTHWIDKKDSAGVALRVRFWAWTDKQTLTREQVHKALGVKSVHDYTGTMDDARAAIEKWIKAQAAAVMAGDQ